MAITKYEIPKFMIDNICDEFIPPLQSISDIFGKLYEEREEMLLAVLAAGVPANCISLTGTSTNYNFHSHTIDLGFMFIRSI